MALAAGSTGAARRALEAAVAGVTGMPEARLGGAELGPSTSAMARTNKFAARSPWPARSADGRPAGQPQPLVERANEILRQGRGRILEFEPWHPLTARGFKVAQLIGERLHDPRSPRPWASPKAASSHVEHILAKLGASRQAEIARRGERCRRPARLRRLKRGSTLDRSFSR